MDQPIFGAHRILGGTIQPWLDVVNFATTAILFSEYADSWTLLESIKLDAKHNARMQEKQEYCHISMGSVQ